jgi:Ala-tRNA(Pro) deacylase
MLDSLAVLPGRPCAEAIMSVSQKLKDLLDRNQIRYQVIPHPPVFTAQETAQAIHTPGRQLAKTIVLRHGGNLALAVLPAQSKVVLERLDSLLGGGVELAAESDFARAFPDCELGAMPPFGNLYGLPTYVDESLTRDREIAFNAGTHTEAIKIAFEDYRRLAQPRILWFAEQPASSRD